MKTLQNIQKQIDSIVSIKDFDQNTELFNTYNRLLNEFNTTMYNEILIKQQATQELKTFLNK